MADPRDTTSLPRNNDSEKDARLIRYGKLLLNRFPHVQSISLQLLMKSTAFIELCEEYEECSRTVEQLERDGTDASMLREYTALRLRLEGELLGYISRFRGKTSR